jgi:hypothetical protein
VPNAAASSGGAATSSAGSRAAPTMAAASTAAAAPSPQKLQVNSEQVGALERWGSRGQAGRLEGMAGGGLAVLPPASMHAPALRTLCAFSLRPEQH